MAEQIKKADPKVEAPPAFVRFESVNEEQAQFAIMGIRGLRKPGDALRVVWSVPSETVGVFEKHHFVVTGRVKRS